MAFPQIKRKFPLFGSSTKSPPLSPQISSSPSLSITFSQSQEIRENYLTPDDIRKSIENLEKLVSAVDEYRDCVNKLSKISKNLGKCLKDYGNCKGINKSQVQCLQITAQFYENYAEVQAKLNKALRRESETLQKFWEKYSKKITKDEKAHNDYIGDLDKQIKKIYEKKNKKENRTVLEHHDKYTTSLASINSDIARARTEHAEEIMRREKHTHSVVSQIVCRLIESQIALFNDSIKKCGPNITKIKEWAHITGHDIPPLQGLDDFLEMQIMTLPSENKNNNNDVPISSEKSSRRSSFRISQSIASISEIQKTAMNNKSQKIVPLIEESKNVNIIEESLFPESQISTTSILEKSTDHVFSLSTETTTNAVITESTNDETVAPFTLPIVTAVTKINPPISSTNNKPPTSNLLSDLSIGIDIPFLREDSSGKIILSNLFKEETNSITKTSEETKSVKTMMTENKRISINKNEKGNSIKLEDNNIVSLTPPPIYDKSRDFSISNNKRKCLKKDQIIGEEINSSNSETIKNTFRISFIENSHENEVRRNSIDKRSSYDCNDDEYERTINEKEIHPTPSFDTDILVNSFPIELPVRSIPQTLTNQNSNSDCDQIIMNNNRYDEEKHVEHNMNESSSYSTNSFKDRPSLKQFDIKPRRAYTEYPLNNSKHGPSVADIREQLLSLNSNEKRQTIRDLLIPKQGYVNEVKSKFGDINNSKNNDTSTTIKSPDSINSYRNDTYPESSEGMNSSKPTINEQCNCHNCQEISTGNHDHHPKDSFLPEDDLTTFGRNHRSN